MHGGAPAGAQLELPPLTLTPTDPATTTTTLLPNLLADPNLLPAPQPNAPPSSLLPLPTAPPPRRTTSFKPTPVPPSTPVRAPKVAAKPKAPAAPTTGATAAPIDESELGEGDPGYGAELPFPGDNGAGTLSAADTMELGIEDSTREQVGTLASLAAGLIAFVLLGIALWLRSEVRRPAPLPPW
jgi:hypothetical protein